MHAKHLHCLKSSDPKPFVYFNLKRAKLVVLCLSSTLRGSIDLHICSVQGLQFENVLLRKADDLTKQYL